MSDYPMLISNKLHSFRNFHLQSYEKDCNCLPLCSHICYHNKSIYENALKVHKVFLLLRIDLGVHTPVLNRHAVSSKNKVIVTNLYNKTKS